MLKKKKPVLDERELQEMYRIEHLGLWLMYVLLCLALLVQLMMGAGLAQLCGELTALLAVSVVMIAQYVRHGIWDADVRPSAKDNAGYSAMIGIIVAAILAIVKRNALAAVGFGTAAGALCFAALMLMMRFMQRRQAQQENELDN